MPPKIVVQFCTKSSSVFHTQPNLTLIVIILLWNIRSLFAQVSTNPDDVHFFLFPDPNYPNSRDEIVYNDVESLQISRFRPGLKTVFIIHGFRSNVSSEMPQVLKNAFLESRPEYNIVVVSWGALATPMPPEQTANLYILAVRNVPIVVQRLTEFLIFLINENMIKISDLYLIGHSLGAHVSGLTGKNVSEVTGEKIPRITASNIPDINTGLDPAGPYFYPPTSSRNLMSDNANFVQVIHTNMGVLGDMTRDGHADFYPNGGSEQPNCREGDNTSQDMLGVCSHRFSYKLYAASMIKDFPSCPCSPFMALYSAGLCREMCNNPVKMGFNCPPESRGEFYLKITNPP